MNSGTCLFSQLALFNVLPFCMVTQPCALLCPLFYPSSSLRYTGVDIEQSAAARWILGQTPSVHPCLPSATQHCAAATHQLLWSAGAKQDNQSTPVHLDFVTSFGASPCLCTFLGARICLAPDCMGTSRMGHTQHCCIHFALGLRVPCILYVKDWREIHAF